MAEAKNARQQLTTDADLAGQIVVMDGGTVEERVSLALSDLMAMPKVVLDLRFGLNGQSPLSLRQIADKLNNELSPELKATLASHRGMQCETIIITEAEVGEWEEEGLRALRQCGTTRKAN